jgi:hypothetical protein
MATYGYTFTSGDTLTPTKLNNARSVSDIANADIASAAAIDKTKIAGTAITAADTGTVTSTMLADGTITNTDINASAAIAHTKLATMTAGQVLLGNASNVPTATALSGDVTVTSSGVTAIAAGVVVNADISASAAIDKSKLNLAGQIVNADINASAAISDTKLATIATAGKVSNSATTATNANTASAIVARDASGNFVAGTITADVTGNAATSTKLSSAKTFALTGDVTGSASSDLTTGPSIAATIANDAVTFAKMQNSAAAGLSVVGRSAATAGDFAEITAGTDGHVVRRSGSSVGFGTVATAGIADAAVTAPKLSGAQTGTAPIYGVRAWVNFNGTRNVTDTGASTNGANVLLKASGNVTSVLKNATGDYTITFTTALPDANYAVSAMTTGVNTGTNTTRHVVVKGDPTSGASDKTTTTLTILCGSSAASSLDDMADVSVMVIR